MSYSINQAAEELMLEPEDLKEIFECFFSEADEILPKCEEALEEQDAEMLKENFHALKGSAANLRIKAVSDLALTLENEAKKGNFPAIAVSMSALKKEIVTARVIVNHFYGK